MSQFERLEHGLRELRRNEAVELYERVDLRAWTALGVGGPASLVVRCHCSDAVRQTLELAASHGLGWLVLGGGSRLVPPDGGIRVPLLSLTGDLGRWELDLDGLIAGAGANMAQVCRAASRNRLAGLERIPGGNHSVGGVVRATSDGLIRLDDLVEAVELSRPGSSEEWWRPADGDSAPVDSELRRKVITRVRFRLRPARPTIAPERIGLTTRGTVRVASPVFLDAPDASAADLLSEAGMATAAVGGVRLGGAEGNQLAAGRSASSTDVLDLCRRARDRVVAVTGVELAPALVFVDEDGREIRL